MLWHLNKTNAALPLLLAWVVTLWKLTLLFCRVFRSGLYIPDDILVLNQIGSGSYSSFSHRVFWVTAVTFLSSIPEVPDSNLGWDPDCRILWLPSAPQLNCWDSTDTILINTILNHADMPGCWYVLSATRKETSYGYQILTFASHSKKKKSEACPSNQVSATAMTSALDVKCRSRRKQATATKL